MRNLRTLVGFVLILGLLTLGVVGLDYLSAPATLQIAFAILLGGFGLITLITAFMSRPSAGTILAIAGAALALFIAVQEGVSGSLDLLLFALVIFDVIVLFVLFGEIDRTNKRRQTSTVRVAERAAVAAALAATEAKPAKKATKKSSKTTAKATKKSAAKKASRTSAKKEALFVASKKTEGGKFHLVNCYIAQRIDNGDRDQFNTREKALAAGYAPCRICNP